MTPEQKAKVNNLVAEVNNDMSQITSQEIFKIFASPDKSLPNGVKISRI
jgi:hypothetical protein